MLLLPLLMSLSASALGQLGDSQFGDDFDPELADFDLDIAPRRVPRQVKTLLTKETKPHIQELSIKTTIISRYAFTAVYCAMLNRHSTAAEGVFQFQVPAGAYVSNFTIPEPEVEVFRMAASIPGRNRAIFLLTYEELLQRRLGRYEHVTSLRPLQLVTRLSLDVTIVDHSPVTDLQVMPLRNGRTAGASSSSAPTSSSRPRSPPTASWETS